MLLLLLLRWVDRGRLTSQRRQRRRLKPTGEYRYELYPSNTHNTYIIIELFVQSDGQVVTAAV